jgi:hypothetical protein
MPAYSLGTCAAIMRNIGARPSASPHASTAAATVGSIADVGAPVAAACVAGDEVITVGVASVEDIFPVGSSLATDPGAGGAAATPGPWLKYHHASAATPATPPTINIFFVESFMRYELSSPIASMIEDTAVPPAAISCAVEFVRPGVGGR